MSRFSGFCGRHHAWADRFTSLAALLGVFWGLVGYQLADPPVGLLISIAILLVGWDADKSVFSCMVDGVEPDIVDKILQVAQGRKGKGCG